MRTKKRTPWYLSPGGKKSHLKSNAKWLNKSYRNQHKSKIYRLRSYCKNFILKKANAEDIKDMKHRIQHKAMEIGGNHNE